MRFTYNVSEPATPSTARLTGRYNGEGHQVALGSMFWYATANELEDLGLRLIDLAQQARQVEDAEAEQVAS